MSTRSHFSITSTQTEPDLSHFFNLIQGMFYCLTLDGHIQSMNTPMLTTLGYRAADLVNRSLLDLIHPEDRLIMQNCLQHGSGAARIRCKNGDYRWLDWKMTAQYQSGSVCGLATDITSHKEAEMLLRASEQRFKAFMDNSPAIAFMKDEAGRIVYVNPIYIRTFGLPDDWYGKKCSDLLPFEAAAEIQANDEAVFASGKPLMVKENVMHSDGIHTWLCCKFPLRDIDGQVYLAGVGVDITDQQHIAMLTSFIEKSAYEFVAPLSVVQSSLYLIEKQTDPEKQKTHIHKIREQALGLEKLLNAMVTLATLDRERTVDRLQLDAQIFLNDVTVRVTEQARHKGLTLHIETAPTLPMIAGDVHLLERAFTEVLLNAIHYTPAGGQVMISASAEGSSLVVRITDTGIGMTAEQQAHIFEHFYRADPTQPSHQRGLGLPIVRMILELHGGTIRVASAPNQGSTITLTLPTC